MNTNITKSLNHLLFEKGFVTIPGFGSFEIQQQSAIVDPVTGKIHPPGSKLLFIPIIQSDYSLKQLLTKHFKYTDQEAENSITEFVREIKTKLEQKEIVYIDGIGKLFLNHDDSIAFLPTTFNFTQNNYGLPDVNYTPVQPREVPKAKAPKKSLLGARLRAGALPALTIVAFLFISFNVYFLVKKHLDSRPAQTAQVVHVNQKPSAVIPSPVPLMDKITNIDTEEKTTTKEKAQPAIEVEDDLNVDETKARTLENNECIIIAGTFSTKKNASKMIKDLINQGYAPYKDKKGKNWRVGIIFPYHSVYDIKANLEDLSKTYHTSAWILKK